MDYKQVMVVRRDLGMSAGKTCAQVAHASLNSAEKGERYNKKWHEAWLREGQKKVVVQCGDERELFELYETAKGIELPCFLVKDAGLTQLEPGTATALGIGPAPEEMVDKVTGELKLL